MTKKLTLSALALILAAPAFAGTTQLERAADVDAGVYSVSELGLITSAETEREAARLKAFFDNEAVSDVSRANFSTDVNAGEWIRHPGSDR